MKNLFDTVAASEILNRLEKLYPDTQPLWGKMKISQMLAHCQVPLQVALGEKQLKRNLISILFGGIARRQLTKETIFKKNLPTAPQFIIKDERQFDNEKQQLQSLIQQFSIADANEIAGRSHPFFGKMTKEEWGILQWKHLDHHFRQFGV